jgi:hypothetical protein
MLDARAQAEVDAFLAMSLEIQVRLLDHYTALQAEGWPEERAWAFVCSTECRLLEPIMEEWDDG